MSPVRDALAPLLIVAAFAVIVLADMDIVVADGLASLISGGSWSSPPLSLDLVLRLLTGPDDDSPPSGTFVAALSGVAIVELGGLVVACRAALRWAGVGKAGLLRGDAIGDLAGPAAEQKARDLRPSLASTPTMSAADRGIRLMTLARRDVWMSWEDVALVIMGPRANKTSALAVPSVISAPGLAIATSNKADLWSLTRGMRASAGPLWTFDPQQIAHVAQTWWWDPLRSIREARPDHRMDAASRLAGHFMGTVGGARRDPFFHSAGEQVLTGTLLAVAIDGGTMRDVAIRLQSGRRDAIASLDAAGAAIEAADLEASLSGAEVTTKGIFQTARTATRALTSERNLRWITPPPTWREPPARPLTELDPWEVLRAAQSEPTTLHLLSKEGAGTAAPIVAALVDRVLETAELLAQASGGRIDPPIVAVLDEAANICPIPQLPQLYSHYGSRGIQVITMLQSYRQGVGVWGDAGMDALWSAATIKIVGAGVDDHSFLQRLSGLIGDRDVEKLSTSYSRGSGPSRQVSTTREPIMSVADLRALSKREAVLLSTGRRVGIGQLRPWYREHELADLASYAEIALGELRTAAVHALGSDNPVVKHATDRRHSS